MGRLKNTMADQVRVCYNGFSGRNRLYVFEIREDETKDMEVKDFIEGVLITGGSWICAVVLIGFPIKTWSYKNKRKYQHYKIKLEKFEESQRKDYSYPVYKYTDEWGQKQLFHDKKSLVHKGDIAMMICGICAFLTAVFATAFMIQEFLKIAG